MTGQNINSIGGKLAEAQTLGLIQMSNNRIVATNKGYDFLNDCQQMFL